MSPFALTLLDLIRRTHARVGVVGLGYAGLPLARAFSLVGFRVLGCDTDSAKVATLSAGESYIAHVPSEHIREMLANGFEATDRFDRMTEADVLLLCVPTPLTATREPDLQYVVGASEAVARHLRRGQLVVLESTSYPGTTRKVVLPLLTPSRLLIGEDFFLAFSPEREDPGNPALSVTAVPKVVGGICPTSLEVAAALYGRVAPSVVRVSSPEVAEACKLLENTYRAVNIALVNEIKVLYDRMGIDVWEVIEAARTKPFGFRPFYPGPGLGGPCIPVNPFYLSWIARQHGVSARLIELAGEVNAAMPAFVVARVADALNDAGKPMSSSRVLILGMAYKKDVDDPRESPGFELMDLLLNKGAVVSYNDPRIPELPRMRRWPHLRMTSTPLTPETLAAQDCVLIATDHTAYDYAAIVTHSRLVIDTRNATKAVVAGREKIVRA